ncbi:hypothetical protein Tco_1018702 [Tanacetum coccineum]|uniref:Uncharacterized protein n=1 Tax=Tanacetum coccineum TaxID=301880 RepID=A0ABQ5FXK6_9ASTR
MSSDIIKNIPCYNAFLITADVPEIYMQQFWFTIKEVKKSSFYQFDIANKTCQIDVELFQEILGLYPRVQNQEFTNPLELSSTNAYQERYQAMIDFDRKELKFCEAVKGLIPIKIERGKGAKGTKATIASKKNLAKKNKYSDEESDEQKEKSQKLKGIDLLYVVAQLEIDTQKAVKASIRESRFQHQASGSSEGVGITPEVPYEPTGKSTVSDEGAGTSPEVLDETKDKSEAQDDLDD